MSDDATDEVYRWPFGNAPAALLIARTAWPNENDEARQSWSKRLTDPADRPLLDQEYQRARDRLDSAYALLAAAPAPSHGTRRDNLGPSPCGDPTCQCPDPCDSDDCGCPE